MSQRYITFLKTVLVALVLAMAPLLAANIILDNYARQQAVDEMDAMGNRAIRRAETAIRETVMLLQRLDRDDVETCSTENRHIIRSLILQYGMVDTVGLADSSGKRMCIVPDQRLDGEAILPTLRPEGPLVGIGMLERSYLGARAAVVSWDIQNGTRLFAEVTPAVLAADPGPEYLRSHRRIEVRLGDNLLWYEIGGYGSEGAKPGDVITISAQSDLYPLTAHVRAPLSAAIEVVHDLKVVSAAACAGVAILFVAIGVWFSWRPESEADDEFVRSIKNGEFIPYYQPVVDIESNQLRGCEVLMRWRRASGEMVSPGQFMAYAEAHGHIFEMTRHLMRVCAVEMNKLYSDNPDLKLSINLFAGHFLDRRIVTDIRTIFEPSDISFQQIVMEVTERYPLADMELARKIMAEMQALGVRIALDDAGTGHGGMAYLQKLGVDIIKIDKMFIDTINSDDNSTAIVDSMVELADNLGMGIIAEGVEEPEQIEKLLEMGVTAAQGYYFAKPMPADEYIAFSAKMEAERIEAERLAAEAEAAEEAAKAAMDAA